MKNALKDDVIIKVPDNADTVQLIFNLSSELDQEGFTSGSLEFGGYLLKTHTSDTYILTEEEKEVKETEYEIYIN